MSSTLAEYKSLLIQAFEAQERGKVYRRPFKNAPFAERYGEIVEKMMFLYDYLTDDEIDCANKYSRELFTESKVYKGMVA